MLIAVITTIYPDAPAIAAVGARVDHLLLVGDRKTPPSLRHDVLTVGQQERDYPLLAQRLPFDHYVRKNIGYLAAIRAGATTIYDTDDDNHPHEGWAVPAPGRSGLVAGGRFVNIYRLFSSERVWPRGLPLDVLRDSDPVLTVDEEQPPASVHVWQALADRSPDVDALWRLVDGRELFFEPRSGLDHVRLRRGCFCPFNSQSTFWVDPASFAFLYLPSTVGFRFTDILRSYVATFGIWARSGVIGFCRPCVEQHRNPHSDFRDFQDEIEMYAHGSRIVDDLAACSLRGVDDDLLVMYEQLARKGVVRSDEVLTAERWLEALRA